MGLQRTDFYVTNDAGQQLWVREIRKPGTTPAARPPVLLVHGARVPGLPSFDLPVEGGSPAAGLVEAGQHVYLMDVRGYGRSDRPAEMQAPPTFDRTLVRANEAAQDIAVVVEELCRRTGAAQVALFGWATGGMWCGYYAAWQPRRVEALVLYNTLYRSPGHPTLGVGSNLEDPSRPGRFNTGAIGSYRFNAGRDLLNGWDASIPVGDLTTWRDPAVASTYVAEALASDAAGADLDPPSFRAPSGALEDSFTQALGRQLWDASLIRARTLVIAGERDFWSQPIDRAQLAEHLTSAREVQVEVIPNATHFVHLERPERGQAQFLATVLSFLAASDSADQRSRELTLPPANAPASSARS